MATKNIRGRSGFTIIEVVLVLAVAGLIFMMVFLALPAMQRSQRDRQRQSDLGRLSAAVSEYKGNNNGRVPGHTDLTDWNSLRDNYLGGEDGFSGPNNPYTFRLGTCGAGKDAKCETEDGDNSVDSGDEVIVIYNNASCAKDDNGNSLTTNDTNDAVKPASGTSTVQLLRRISMVIKLEGSGVLYCLEN